MRNVTAAGVVCVLLLCIQRPVHTKALWLWIIRKENPVLWLNVNTVNTLFYLCFSCRLTFPASTQDCSLPLTLTRCCEHDYKYVSARCAEHILCRTWEYVVSELFNDTFNNSILRLGKYGNSWCFARLLTNLQTGRTDSLLQRGLQPDDVMLIQRHMQIYDITSSGLNLGRQHTHPHTHMHTVYNRPHTHTHTHI